jgi:NAD(P)H-flavin reductase
MNPFVPALAEIVDRKQETSHIFTLRLRLKDKNRQKAYQFKPGQFNMVYALGVGEVPISIVSDPTNPDLLDHTIRTVGTVTTALEKMKKGHVVGLRGPFGSAWPLEEAQGKNVIIVTGGLGCAPTVSPTILRDDKNFAWGQNPQGPFVSEPVPVVAKKSQHRGFPHGRSSGSKLEIPRRGCHQFV